LRTSLNYLEKLWKAAFAKFANWAHPLL
jgi:hypothetical protein